MQARMHRVNDISSYYFFLFLIAGSMTKSLFLYLLIFICLFFTLYMVVLVNAMAHHRLLLDGDPLDLRRLMVIVRRTLES